MTSGNCENTLGINNNAHNCEIKALYCHDIFLWSSDIQGKIILWPLGI